MRVVTAEMWEIGRWIRLGGMVAESCCEVEVSEKRSQATGETWGIEVPEGAPAGCFVLVCRCGGRAFLSLDMLDAARYKTTVSP